MKRTLIYVIATSFGLGFSPWISGTVGSLGGVLLFALAVKWVTCLPLYLGAIVLLFALGVWAASAIEKEKGAKDPGIIVIDEVVGMMITYIAVPFSLKYLLIGFVLFRILDILKPFPANTCEKKIPGGWGVMLDDVVSGLYAWGALQLIILLTS